VQRSREQVKTEDGACGLCGHVGLVIERSWKPRSGFSRLNPAYDAQERTYRVCRQCGARQQLINGLPV
jgi:hypothetical protein